MNFYYTKCDNLLIFIIIQGQIEIISIYFFIVFSNTINNFLKKIYHMDEKNYKKNFKAPVLLWEVITLSLLHLYWKKKSVSLVEHFLQRMLMIATSLCYIILSLKILGEHSVWKTPRQPTVDWPFIFGMCFDTMLHLDVLWSSSLFNFSFLSWFKWYYERAIFYEFRSLDNYF